MICGTNHSFCRFSNKLLLLLKWKNPPPSQLRGLVSTLKNCPFRSSNGDSGQVSKLLEIGVHHKNDHIKISQFTKCEVLSLDCNHVEGVQKSEILQTLYGIGGSHLRIRDICMEFGRPLTGHSLVTT